METKRICGQCGAVVVSGPTGHAHDCPSTTVLISPQFNNSPKVGSIQGDYEIMEEVGHGGMGVVHKARQLSRNRVVAYKTIPAGHITTEAELQRFYHEAQTAAGLEHPNIVTVYETGKFNGQPFISMPFIRGVPLSKMKLPFLSHEAARLLITVARAVHFAHQHGIVHRDLKPGNIIIDVNGVPHITDFGIAKRLDHDVRFTQTGMVPGTPGYISPEEASGSQKNPSPAGDVFSLGAVLYFLLTGTAPFAAPTPLESLIWTIERDPIAPSAFNPHLDPDLEKICLKCLEKNPLARYHSAAELADDLEHWLRGEKLGLKPARLWQRLRHWYAANPWATNVLLIIFSLLSLLLIYALYCHLKFVQEQLTRAYPREISPHWLDPIKIGISSPLWSFFLGLLPLAWFQRQKHFRRPIPAWLYATLGAAEWLAGLYLVIKFIDALAGHIPLVWYGRPVLLLPAFTFFWFGSLLLWELFRERRLAHLHLQLPPATTFTRLVQHRQNIFAGAFLSGCLLLLLGIVFLLPSPSPESTPAWTTYPTVGLFLGLWLAWLPATSGKIRSTLRKFWFRPVLRQQ